MLRLVSSKTDAKVRHELLAGVDHLVVPVVAMVEGVRQPMGSSGPELILAAELARVLGGWNGRPVVFHAHPTRDGAPISAASPEVFERVVGTVFNAAMDGDKLLCEAWIDLARAASVDGAAATVEKLEAGTVVEVSVSYFAAAEKKSGKHNGVDYVAVQRSFVPDHLAIDINLGACSVASGCGAPRSNCAGGTECAPCKEKRLKIESNEEPKPGVILAAIRRWMGGGQRSNAEGESFRAVEEAINAALAAANPGADWVYVRDVFPDEGLVVYDIGGQPFQRSYTIDASGAVTLTGDPIAVVMEVNYTPVGTKPPAEGEKMEPTKVVSSETQEEINALKAKIADLEAKLAEAEKTPVANEIKLTDAELLAAMSPEMRSSIESGMAAQSERKANLVTALKAHKANPYTEDQLKAFSVGELESLGKLAGLDTPAPDFSGLGGPRANADESKATPPPSTWAGPKAA